VVPRSSFRERVSKPAIILALGAVAMALAIIFGVLDEDDERAKRTSPLPSETGESITEPVPSAPTEAVREPRPPLLASAPTAVPKERAEQPAPKRLDEASLVARLHDLAASDPPRSLNLAREALERFPDSPRAPEFEWNVVKALANMDRYQEAEDEARVMLEKYPDSPLSVDVEHHVLHHPPNPLRTP
jgi:hypothetical protein